MKRVLKLLDIQRKDISIIKYEGLVENSSTIIKNLCKFLKIEFYESMLTPDRSNTSFKELKKKKEIYKEAKDKWREILIKEEISIVEKICSNLMIKFGYKPDNPKRAVDLNLNIIKLYLFLNINISLGKVGYRPFRAYLNNILEGKVNI